MSAATYRVGGGAGAPVDITTIKASPGVSFGPEEAPARLRLEADAGFLFAEEDISLALSPEGPTRADATFRSYTALLGAGPEIDAPGGVKVRALGLIGYGRVTDEADVTGPFADVLEAGAQGVLFDIFIDNFLYGAAVEAEKTQVLPTGIEVAARVRYTHLWERTISASNAALRGEGNFGALAGTLELDGATGWRPFGLETRWIAFGSGSYLPGATGDALGFRSFAEIGAGFEIVEPQRIPFVEGVAIRGSRIAGGDVRGWTFGVSAAF